MKWFPLCNYTHYSLQKGYSKPDTLIKKCVKEGYGACGIADYKSISGAVSFFNECVKNDVHPIIGCSFDTFKLFAKNKEGWHDLIRITSSIDSDGSYSDGFVKEICAKGNLLCVSLSSKEAPLSGPDLYYHCLDTVSSYYVEKDEAVLHRVMLCASLKTTLSKVKKKAGYDTVKIFFERDDLCVKDASQVNPDGGILNQIRSKCESYNILRKPMLPHFPTPNGESEEEYLYALCQEGWEELLVKTGKVSTEADKQIYQARLDKEFAVIKRANLFGYFLIVQDIINYVNGQGWMSGPGRGSAAGCLISYLSKIIQVDPIEFDLLFERFYNDGRNTEDHISLPDIDMDIPGNKRDEIISYIKDKYGHGKVSQMITFTRLRGRSALKQVLRINESCGFSEMNAMTKPIPDEAEISDQLELMDEDERSIIMWALMYRSKDLMDFCHLDEDDNLVGDYAEQFRQAIEMEGTFNAQSKHAAGVVISSEELSNVCPMVNQASSLEKIAGLEMNDLEMLGHVKFDVLALKLLDKLMQIQDRVKERYAQNTLEHV